ncbi:MAG: 2-amino-4-hydroxy-6-hydroxymethyldihydropteridine diphosphokinase [Acidobacteria bacterium]|nr:MAG: 2-amino-4-hydroxy-6-hydroxymethyldihydropteridine diphosphokinase [Acidobacteriota bacterium]
MPTVFVGIGSNVGDRRHHLSTAVEGLALLGDLVAVSPIYETAPVGDVDQGHFLNAVAHIEVELSPRDFLKQLIEIEQAAGRVRVERWGPRTLDLDILTYGAETIDEPGLIVPHPEMRKRRFVLTPLVDLTPGLADARGAFADSLGDVADQDIRRVTGPYEVDIGRWMDSIETATELTETPTGFRSNTSPDWVNRTGNMFGAFLSALALRAVGATEPEHVPSSLTYRFAHPVPLGATLNIEPVKLRRSARSADHVVSLLVDDVVVGMAFIGTVASLHPTEYAPEFPDVLSPSECESMAAGWERSGITLGTSGRSWKMLERWDMLDLADSQTALSRAWCPNVALGTDNPYVRAAAVLMPIDVLVWRSAMSSAGLLGTDRLIVTPTIEFSGRFGNLAEDPGFHLAEVKVEHMSKRSVFVTTHVWSENGAHIAVGSSHNLVVEPT